MGDEFFKQNFRPLLPDISFIEFNNFADLEKISCKTACVFIEPVQGEAGIRTPNPNYLQKVKEKCEDSGTILIFDEIQTGFGRTGSLFAFQKYGVVPDVLTIAKAMGAGLPIGGVVANKNFLNLFTNNPILGHITTFGGNPVSASSALAGLNYLIKNKEILDEVENKAQMFKQLLIENPKIIEIRNSGLMMAVELGESKKLFSIIEKFLKNGLVSDWFLFCDTSFRISPPLTISTGEIQLACHKINSCLNEI
jgi:acetylornithine/succinyldiaminopimelate/putrescine aminotransferase